jgi:peroxiredoxin
MRTFCAFYPATGLVRFRFLILLFVAGLRTEPAYCQLKKDSIQVLIFLSESCPVCQQTTEELRRIRLAFPNVKMTGIFPSPSSTIETRKAFAAKYKIDFQVLGDPQKELTRRYNAKITPEAMLTLAGDSLVLFSGKIDNRFESIGKRRTITTNYYLYEAIESILKGKSPSASRIEPVGCIIE